MKTECHHPHVDYINDSWVCGKCYELLRNRPKSYKMVPAPGKGLMLDGCKVPMRQEIVYATISLASEKRLGKFLTLSKFIDMMARRLVVVTGDGFNMSEARQYAIEILRNVRIEFGDKDFAWNLDGAWDLVDGDMQYWDHDLGPFN